MRPIVMTALTTAGLALCACASATSMSPLEGPVLVLVGRPPALPPVPEPPPPPPPPPPKAVVEGGAVVLQEAVEFGDQDAVLTEGSHAVLDEVAQLLTQHVWIETLSIEVHTDRRGSARKNRKLADQRAATLRDSLMERGVAEDRLIIRGHGESTPLTREDSVEAHEQNRRIELLITAGQPPEDPTAGKPVESQDPEEDPS